MAESKTSDTVIKDALDRFEESQSGSDYNREAAYEDIKFARLAVQWPEDIRKQRQAEARPVLTINKLPAFIRQVVNEARQNKPGIKVSPADGGADVATAEVIGGLIRSIERNSQADIAYDTAIDNAVSGGFGFFRVEIDYAHPLSFDLEARIKRIPNAQMVHWDVSSTEFDASDWNYGFVSDLLTEDQFKKRYPKAAPVSFEGDYRDFAADWLEMDRVRVAEYWERAEHEIKILGLSNGRVVREDDLPKMAAQMLKAGGIDMGGQVKDDELVGFLMQSMGVEVLRERTARTYKVKRRIISGVEVLEEDDWPGTMIPICPVWGEEVFSDGRRYFRSMIRDAKDPQAMFNFWRSASTELVALAPRAPWVGPEGFVPKGHEENWQTANTRSHPYLYHVANKVPQRQPFSGVPAGVLQEALSASDDIKAITNLHDPSMGRESNETSGKAILARQQQSATSNFHFLDNLNRAIGYAGRVLVEIIPAVYSPRETIRILGDDMKEKVINLTMEDGGTHGEEGITGQPELYNLSVGKYDVTVSSGPSYATQREETREIMIEIMRAMPESAPILGDVLMEHMDFQGADKVAKRLKKMLPPQALEGEDGAAPPAIPPEIQQQIEQGTQVIGQLQQENAELKQQAQGDMIDARVKAQELQLKAREMELRATEAERDYEIKVAELRLKEAEIMARTQSEQESRAFEGQRMDREDMRAQQQVSQPPAMEGPREPDQGAIITATALQAVAAALEKVNAPRKLVRDPATGAAMGVEPA
jgi:hypothetical protein